MRENRSRAFIIYGALSMTTSLKKENIFLIFYLELEVPSYLKNCGPNALINP